MMCFLRMKQTSNARTTHTQEWYHSSRESPAQHPFDAFRRDGASPPALSPPSSTTSGPTSGSTNPYAVPYSQSYNPLDPPYPTMVPSPLTVTPSPPPQMFLPDSSQLYAPFTPNSTLRPQWRSYGYGNGTPASNGYGTPASNGYGPPGGSDEDLIPTAIVIKNIPFAVPREALLGVIESLGAPLPYAFNYHHDNGVFRGLAFANFRAPEEAASVVAALNGYDVQGRKLRVEYKKVLQPGEKDKIEREKALKRMRSIQFDGPPPNLASPGITLPSPGGIAPVRTNGFSVNGLSHESPPNSASSSSDSQLALTLDMNDPQTLEIYSRVFALQGRPTAGRTRPSRARCPRPSAESSTSSPGAWG